MQDDARLRMHHMWLETFVPLRIAEMERWAIHPLKRCDQQAMAALISEKADLLLSHPKTERQRRARSELVKAILNAYAYLAFLPGGIHVGGMHFEGRWENTKGGQDE